jgi:predicted thioesterase
MSDKRSACRVRRRLPITFSDGSQAHHGQTANLSRTGACIHSDYVVAPGAQLHVTIGLPGIADVRLRAVVEWARKLRGSETLAAAHSMGLRYLAAPGSDYDDFMSVIEGLAQPHGLTTRGEAAAPEPARVTPPPRGAPVAARAVVPEPATRRRSLAHDPRMIDLDAVAAPPPRRAPAIDPRREPEAPAQRRAPAVDPRREPAGDTPARPQREVDVVELHAPIEEVHRRAATSPPRPEKNLDFVVSADDLAAPGEYPCSLSTARVAWLLEQGAAELIAPHLKGRVATVGLSLEVNVPNEPVAVGTAVEVVVALTAIGNDRRSFGFELAIRDGDRLVATGRHLRQLVEPAS